MANIFDFLFPKQLENQRFIQDAAALQQFRQQQQLAGRTQLPAGVAGPVVPPPQFPIPTSQRGASVANRFFLDQQAQQGRLALQGPPSIADQRAFEALQTGARPGSRRFERIATGPEKPVTSSFQQITDPNTGQLMNALVSPVTGNVIKRFGPVEQGLSAKDKVQVAVTQAKEFRADPRIKNFQIIERSERGMQAALKAATGPNVKSRIASDQALGVLFQKMLDPESVVRESEFARTPQGASAVNRLLAIAPQLRLGGLKLLDEDREALVDMAQSLLNGAKVSANQAFNEFTRRADEIDLNKNIVFGGRKRFDIPDAQSPLTDIERKRARLAELEAKARQ